MTRDEQVREIARDLKRRATVMKIKRTALEAAETILRKTNSDKTRLTILTFSQRGMVRIQIIVQRPSP